jgi:hypothetical protein
MEGKTFTDVSEEQPPLDGSAFFFLFVWHFFDPEDGISAFLSSFGKIIPVCKESRLRRYLFS